MTGSFEEEVMKAQVRQRKPSPKYNVGDFINPFHPRTAKLTSGWQGPYPIIEVGPTKGTLLIKIADKLKVIRDSDARPVKDTREIQWIGMTMDRVPRNGEPPLDTIFNLGERTERPISERTWKSIMIWITAVFILGTVGTVLKLQRSGELTTA